VTCFGLLIIFQCTQPSPAVPSSTFCQIAKPIYWSATDTRQTKEQVDRHNAQWKRVCAVRK